MSTLYEFKSVTYTAPPREIRGEATPILLDASFDLPRGVFSVITGPSGSGKSTLLRLFNRLADPTAGTIRFDGKDIREYPVTGLRRRIGWVPQVPVRFPGTLEQNLRLPFRLSKDTAFTPEEIEKSIARLKSLELLPDRLFQKKADDLSVGEAQRLNLLRAIALEPEVLLLDEPTSALDPERSEALLDQIVKTKRERNLTVIMVSHRPDEVKKVGELVLRITDGNVKAEAREREGG